MISRTVVAYGQALALALAAALFLLVFSLHVVGPLLRGKGSSSSTTAGKLAATGTMDQKAVC